LLNSAETLVDLGCGTNPHPRASCGVDAFIEPTHRQLGHGETIKPATLNCEFIRADLSSLPFADKQFDVAYSHHVFEHVPDPRSACREMTRVARRGVIITPSPFAEIAFGREYHLWMVFHRGKTIFFLRKRKEDDRPFGAHPAFSNGSWRALSSTNAFDILLNDGSWYHGLERMRRLETKIKHLWYSRSPIMETMYFWEGDIRCVVIEEDGKIH
jgi:SAM-dependent methyltransferase